MTGLSSLVLLGALAALGSPDSLKAAEAEPLRRTNVVLIVADDLGWADLGCYGSKFHRTPHLDALAGRGVRFTDAYAGAPVCSPTRAALMTGMHPARLNLTDWLPGRGDRPDQKLKRPVIRQQLPLDETTLAELFRSAGYATGHIGKWHLGGEGFGPREQGFDVNIGGDHTGTPLSYFAPFRGARGGEQARTMPGLENAPDGEYLTDRLAIEAEKFIADHAERPFFLYVPHYGVHTPMKAPADAVATFAAWDGKPAGKQQNPIYAAMLERVDASVGRITAQLDKLKLTDNTLVIFTSDNGGLATIEGPNTPATYNGPLREGKGYLYEGGLRVPLIAAGAGVTAKGKTPNEPVWAGDVLPTLAEVCKLPSESHPTLDGQSIAALFRGDRVATRSLYWHYPHYANQGGKPGGAIRRGNWKLIEFYENGRCELYDVRANPGESKNLSAEQPVVVKELAAELDAWRKSVGAQMPTPNEAYVPNPQAKDGSITLAARTAEVHGLQLRYEPLPHKNTLGFWTRVEDHAEWEFTITKPGRFEVVVHQGCGTGQGGSTVDVEVAGEKLSFTVEDTGHFQNFVPRSIGTVALDGAGKHRLVIRPRTKAKAAVMDVRQVELKPTTGK
jgi:arylsulfatase A-like enzyme